MNRRILLLAIALAVCLAASGCQSSSNESSSPVTSQTPVSEPASSVQPEPESSRASSSSSQPLTFEEELAELKHGLSLTHPYSPEHGRMNNGFAGIQTEVYEEDNVRMEYPVLSDNRFIPEEEISWKTEHLFALYTYMREDLKEKPFLFLKKYDLESEGTSIDLTYRVITFDPVGLDLHYFGTYTSTTGEKIPIHFIYSSGCNNGILYGGTEQTGKYTAITGYGEIAEYIFLDGGPYTITADDPSKQKAAEEYIESTDLTEFFYNLYYPSESQREAMVKGEEFPKGYYYSKDGKFITMIEVPAEYGYWITLTFDIEDLVNYSTMFGAILNPNWKGDSSSNSN
ncbi:hypothetical protein [Solibaculum mannosilyticum]|uniref:hypothetical protein n=1 Tax=Solibaculum mannosilyticum TaxID=2780922 RepID=UPI0007A875CF|nr:hypothetical protein BN3661_00607 [Eubacteriaceae bacterium CHKCI005]